jgi:hypothetical protein
MSERQGSLQPIAVSSSPARTPSCGSSIAETPRGLHEEKLLQVVSFVEEILFVRWQSLDEDPAHKDERLAMEAIADDLLVVKIHRLGWPNPCR